MVYHVYHVGKGREMVTLKSITIADEVWIATALLHREQPDRPDFTIREIQERVASAGIAGRMRPGVLPHIYLHCVANHAPNPSRLCMLFASGPGTRRLWRPGDPCHPQRTGGRRTPNPLDLPERYRDLVTWYRTSYAAASGTPNEEDPVLALRGLGKDIWRDEHPDAYVRRLRERWE